METLDPPPKIKDGKMARFCPWRGYILALGVGVGRGRGFLFHFILSKIAKLDKIKDEKTARFCPSRGFVLDLGGGGGGWWFAVPFYCVQDYR